jgi:bis(5'-nucleosyl)-tetraphosphatase (symmetrical)
MATYAIGDVQGCFNELNTLLATIQFDLKHDKLWFVGDLINRGPESLKTLEFIYGLGDKATVVLGNHDLHLLAAASGADPLKRKDTFTDVLNAPHRQPLIQWLQSRPLLHYDKSLGYVMVHAGLAPSWDLKTAMRLNEEVQAVLQGPNSHEFFMRMYGDTPDTWDEQLTGYERLRVITNYFTRVRFCTPEGKLELHIKGDLNAAPPGYMPWFNVPNRKMASIKVLFGHWAALEGNIHVPNLFALDSGCVWGKKLSALRLDDEQLFQIPCPLSVTHL